MKAYAFEQGTIPNYKMDVKVKDRFDNQPKIIIDEVCCQGNIKYIIRQ